MEKSWNFVITEKWEPWKQQRYNIWFEMFRIFQRSCVDGDLKFAFLLKHVYWFIIDKYQVGFFLCIYVSLDWYNS